MSQRSDSRATYLLSLARKERRALLERMGERQRRSLRHHWRLWAHDGQLPPVGDWLAWLILAGRGFGKTRAGAEWVRAIAEADGSARIALVGASLGEARRVMVEGDSGLIAIAPRGRRPRFEPSKRLLSWPGGAQALLYSAGEPESLRGPQHSHAWCDEIAKWDNAGGGQAWLVGAAPTGPWTGQAGAIAIWQSGNWLFQAPRPGLRLLNRSTGQDIRFTTAWQSASRPPTPTGGTTVDAQARAALAALYDSLTIAGVLPAA